jgi:hypothetical protein
MHYKMRDHQKAYWEFRQFCTKSMIQEVQQSVSGKKSVTFVHPLHRLGVADLGPIRNILYKAIGFLKGWKVSHKLTHELTQSLLDEAQRVHGLRQRHIKT